MITEPYVTNLVKRYKKNKSQSTKVLKEIIKIYTPLMKSIATKTYDYDEACQIFLFQLLFCINNYKPSYNTSFNTYSYPFLVSTKRLVYCSTKYFKYSNYKNDCGLISEYITDDDLINSDFAMDIEKILTKEEYMIYKLNLKKPISNNILIESVKEKIHKYLYST